MYDPVQLRTFLAVARSLSFTRAAEQLGLRQPTVSAHIRKLEQAVGRALFVRDTRRVALTADGEALTGFARDILAAQDQAVGYFSGSGPAGRLRFGVTDDLALTAVPRMLRDFRRLHPRVDLELTVSQSRTLRRRIESRHLDVAFVKHSSAESPGRLVRRDRYAWAADPGLRLDPDRAVPLVAYQAPSPSRSAALEALEGAGREYRITCTVQGVNGILAAVRAGLGVGVIARGLLPEDIVELPSDAGLPELAVEVDFALLTNPRPAASEAAEALASAIMGTGRALSLPRDR